MKKSIYFILLVCFCTMLTACPPNSPEPPPTETITPPSQSVTGTYTLSAFEIYYHNGTVVKSTDAGLKSFSGNLKLRSDNTYNVVANVTDASGATITLENSTGTYNVITATGKIETVDTNGNSAICDYTITGNVMTLIAPYSNADITYHWTKVSDSAASVANDVDAASVTGQVAEPEALNDAQNDQFNAIIEPSVE